MDDLLPDLDELRDHEFTKQAKTVEDFAVLELFASSGGLDNIVGSGKVFRGLIELAIEVFFADD